MPPPPLSGTGGISFLYQLCLCNVHACPRDVFPKYLWYPLMYFHRPFVAGVSWDKDELTRCCGQKVKGQIC